jgi:death-on-curing family protein
MEKEIKKGEIIIYKSKDGPRLDVRLEKETVWLTQKQIAELFGKGIPAINEHIKNIYKEGELSGKSTIRKFRIVQIEGSRKVEREVDLYNLDVVLSVGYRVNSKRATRFRIWATNTLKQYLIQGYTINQKRLLQKSQNLEELQKAISFLREKSKNELLAGQEQEILSLLEDYSKSLSLLEQYDKNKLKSPKGKKAGFVLKYETVQEVIGKIKNDLVKKKEASDLFGRETGHKLESIIKNLYQTFGGKELYKNLEEKAAQLLYLIIKDHPFVDGNKRIASFLFVYFLSRNRYLLKKSGERKINDNALVALALLTATSQPKEKDVIIKIVMNLLS